MNWVGTSWKMNKTLAEGLAFAEAVSSFVGDLDPRIEPFLIPPYTLVREVRRALSTTRIRVGAQNMHWAEEGAWTGEISPRMLIDCGADLVEIGHSERREHFGETDHTVGLKTAAALRHGLVPLVCVGETLAEREAGRADEVLALQTEAALRHIEPGHRSAAIVFAYEPVWAIGEKGVPATSDYADARQALIRRTAGELLATAPPVLYGGSVNTGNAEELIAEPHIDGLFIGRAAWSAEGYIDILRRTAAAIR